MATIGDPCRARSVVAMSKGTNPRQGVARYTSDLLGGQPSSQQPEDLPLAPRDGIGGLPVALFQINHREVFSKRKTFWHASSIYQDLVLLVRGSRGIPQVG